MESRPDSIVWDGQGPKNASWADTQQCVYRIEGGGQYVERIMEKGLVWNWKKGPLPFYVLHIALSPYNQKKSMLPSGIKKYENPVSRLGRKLHPTALTLTFKLDLNLW